MSDEWRVAGDGKKPGKSQKEAPERQGAQSFAFNFLPATNSHSQSDK